MTHLFCNGLNVFFFNFEIIIKKSAIKHIWNLKQSVEILFLVIVENKIWFKYRFQYWLWYWLSLNFGLDIGGN
jgi:hypothetical protein